jgi:hypothetical protein
MDASVFPLTMGHDAAQVSAPLPIPRALISDMVGHGWLQFCGRSCRPSRRSEEARTDKARQGLRERQARQIGRR